MSVYDFADFREYIRARVAELRQSPEGFSFRRFSAAAGFSSPNFLKLVMEGKRGLSIEGSRKVAHGLGLTAREVDYFELLVRANQEKSISERKALTERLIEFKGRQQPQEEPLNSDYYKNWYNIPVREMLFIDGRKRTSSEIGECFVPKLTAREVDQALETLATLNMIKKGAKGQWEPTKETVRTNDFFTSSMILAFHVKMMEMAKDSLTNFKSHEREIGAVTVSLSKKNVEKVREKIKELKAEVLKLSERDREKEDVMQLNLQLFPLTKGIKDV